VDHGPLPEEDFIPGENHPTPVGNRHFAELIGAAIDRSSILVPRFGSAPEGGAGDVSGVAAGGATTAKKLVPETIVDVLPPDLVLVDTAPALNAYGQTSSRPLSVPGDGHPNAAGHRIIARSVEPVIATPAGAI
jgi:hypothetical protein